MENLISNPSSFEAGAELKQFGIGVDEIKTEVQHLLQQTENRFPVEAFPKAVQEIIQATNESLNYPIDFIGASLLYAASVSIGNTFKIEIKKGWQEGTILYLAIVAKAGTNKSHPLTFAIQPILDSDRRTYAEYEKARAEYEKNAALSKSDKEELGADELVKPVWKKFLLSDYTPEALAEVHKFNKRGIGVYCDELAGWFKNFNRYNKGSEMEFWISTWSSKPINIDRKTGEPIFIPIPFISVCGTIQTGILNELAKDSRTQNGFIDRILFVFPNNLQKEYWNDTEINPVYIQNWDAIVSELLSLSINLDDTFNPVPEVLHFTPEAKQLLYKWQRGNADECNDSESEIISGIYAKLEMYAARLSLIIQLMRWACNEGNNQAVSIEAVKGALQLIEYFKNAATRVYSVISNANPVDRLPADRKNLYNSLPSVFETAEGLRIAEGFNVPERSFKRFLNDKEFFTRTTRGEYEKRF